MNNILRKKYLVLVFLICFLAIGVFFIFSIEPVQAQEQSVDPAMQEEVSLMSSGKKRSDGEILLSGTNMVEEPFMTCSLGD